MFNTIFYFVLKTHGGVFYINISALQLFIIAKNK